MKKHLFLILVLIDINAYSQTIKFTNQVRQTKIGSTYRFQIDTAFSNDWRNLATENYVQGYVATHGGIVYSGGSNIGVNNGIISQLGIQGTIAQGANIVITGSGTPTSPYTIAATGTGGGAFTGSLVVSLTDAATISTDASLGYILGSTYRVTLAGNRTIANPTGMVDGQRIVYEIKQDATGSRTVTWGSKFTWSDDIPVVTLSTAAGYVDLVGWVYNQAADKFYVTGANIGVH